MEMDGKDCLAIAQDGGASRQLAMSMKAPAQWLR